MIDLIKKNKIGLELFIVIILFSLMFFENVSLFTIIVNVLGFVVIWEVVRMVTTYAIEDHKVMKLRIVIDGFIVFFLRDLVLVFSNEKYSLEEKEEKVLLVLGILFVLFIFRILSLRFSPNDKNCKTCPSITKNERNEF